MLLKHTWRIICSSHEVVQIQRAGVLTIYIAVIKVKNGACNVNFAVYTFGLDWINVHAWCNILHQLFFDVWILRSWKRCSKCFGGNETASCNLLKSACDSTKL